jgi:HAD superfamily hydrolase (TIGR01484 family)
MRYHALVCDYDGTLAWEGRVSEETLAALDRLRSSGRRLILVTGRELDDLSRVFPHFDLFERIVAENGALLYRPATQEVKILGRRPPEEFIQALRERNIYPLSVGQVIIATRHPYETVVLQVIRDLGLELHVIFNKGAVMVLPSGVNKATGLQAALDELGLSPHNIVGVGDAENDYAFLDLCECSVAVANALPAIKEHVDWVTHNDQGAGVIEVINALITSDLREIPLDRHNILIGTRQKGEKVYLAPYGVNILLAGSSRSGKSTLATGILERLADQNYQFCIIDPEGDYPTLEGAVVLGDQHRIPRITEILDLLENPNQNVVVNLLGISLEDRPAFFESLFPRLQELRARTGHPHWIVVDETHHLLPSSWNSAVLTLPQELQGMMYITVHPDYVSRTILSSVDIIIAIGTSPEQTLRVFSETLGQPPPTGVPITLEPGEALFWSWRTHTDPFWFRSVPPR